MMFEGRPQCSEIDSLDRIDEKRRMRVAEIGADGILERSELQLDMIGVCSPGERDVAPTGMRWSHIDGDASVGYRLRLQQPRNRLDPYAWVAGLAKKEIGNAACRIAAGLGLAAIGIADTHQHLRCGMLRRFEQDQLVASDPGAAFR